jgi:predicted O-linked N-acetylglucosamine transferase (SPINDLY family)
MNTQELQQLIAQAQEHARSGAPEEAVRCFHQALRLAPDNADLLFAAADAERRCGRFDNAEELLRKAVKIRPGFFAAWCNLGAALRELGRSREAIEIFGNAVSLRPESIVALYNSATACLDCLRYDDAGVFLEKAVGLRPEMAGLHTQLAHAYMKQSRFTDAKELLSEALVRHPGSAEILNGLGNCAMEQRDLATAKKYYVRALQIKPDYTEAHYNLGNILREWNHPDEAVKSYRHALRFQPDRTAALVNLGETLQHLGETAASEECFRKAIELDPVCDLAHHNLLVSMNYNPEYSPETVTTAHIRWGEQQNATDSPRNWNNDRSTKRPLRIGYLSPDFCNHPAGSFLEPLLQHHNREQFTVYCYAQTIHEDERTRRFKSLASYWRPVERLNDTETTELIRNDRIDILIDTAGHLKGNRSGVFAKRAAPVQISGIGYPGTVGLSTIDYRITDSIIDPEDSFPEKPLRLEKGLLSFRPFQKNTSPLVHCIQQPGLTSRWLTSGAECFTRFHPHICSCSGPHLPLRYKKDSPAGFQKEVFR